jgi:hypothetical protein
MIMHLAKASGSGGRGPLGRVWKARPVWRGGSPMTIRTSAPLARSAAAGHLCAYQCARCRCCRALYRQFCGPACAALTVGHVGEGYWSFVTSRNEFQCLRIRREGNCHAISTDRAGTRICCEPKWRCDHESDRARRCAEVILKGWRREWSTLRAGNVDGGRWCYR